MSDAKSMSLAELREARARMNAEEDAVSFVRRLTQGRLDLVRAELKHRRGGEDDTANLARVFGQEHGGGSNRPPRDTEVPVNHPLVIALESICEEHGFGQLRSLSITELEGLETALAAFERERSEERKALFSSIDALTAELVARIKGGGADVDAMFK